LRWSERFPQVTVTNLWCFLRPGITRPIAPGSRPDRAQDFGLVFVLGHETGEASPERSLIDLEYVAEPAARIALARKDPSLR